MHTINEGILILYRRVVKDIVEEQNNIEDEQRV